MPSSCKEIRAALAQCLQESDCIMVQRHTAAECLREPLSSTLSPHCQQLKKGFGECRRGMIDMRKRFRGNQPAGAKALQANATPAPGTISGTTESTETASVAGYQLYAGRSAFAGAVKVTSGNEKEPPDWRELENEQYRRDQAAKKKL
ncbi:cytochrome c oxidase assembly protein [Grosmannia clavigera kw1407]|uniref:Cytochrome c oxidase assembly protein n=1 Tax=Grosmannia clavigera (strain kw1407 / UAMH 11150) TaxID=655863 RepID=F0XK49_GROCL|nr:cytochrome c oxidase assembly protein [Grosmannia clavigera kw1407]EFX01997.1 cytochrome c oxidase assembly protein [Grosmannia clavigera kw1407]